MIAWQKQIRDRRAVAAASENLFGAWWKSLDVSIEKAMFREVDYLTAAAIIEEYEWLGNMCANFVRAYGIFWDGNCGGVVVYGSTVNGTRDAKGICGHIEYADRLLQLQRGACVHWAPPHAASSLISYSLREESRRGTRLVIAYSDPAAGEVGTVYQATNWLYCGKTLDRPDYLDSFGRRITGPSGKVKPGSIRVSRPKKHRYLFILGSASERRAIRRSLKWCPQPYPKRHSVMGTTYPNTEARSDSAMPLQSLALVA